MNSILELFGKLDPDNQRRGRQFERICKWFLENDPEYKREIKRVWLWYDWPRRWSRDKGCDLIAETFDGKFWAVQSKAYALHHSVTQREIDSFLTDSARPIISYRLLITTAAKVGHNAKEAIEAQEKPVGSLFFSDLKNRKLNWPSSPDELSAKQELPNKPRPDQKRAIAEVVRGFTSEPRGQLIRACGTGKTLIGLRVAEAMKSQRTLLLVPSISLVSQMLREWTKDGLRPFRFLPVCSHEIRGEDHLAVELGVPSTTNPSEIAGFMRGSGTRVIFSTYKSSPKIALAFKQHRLEPFDLVIADEAHRCAGVEAGEAAMILDSQQIRARRRLFMTATPRIASESSKSRADSMGLELVSMDDQKLFGPVFHELKFSDAIHLKLLTDYRVEIIGVDDPLYRQYAEQGVFVTMDGKTITDARTLASHIAVAKAIKKYDLRRIITFHGRVARAREFADQFPQFIRWMPEADIPSGDIWTELISGDMASNKRDAILDRLREVAPPARGVVTNARCLGEGIDVRALDGVAFIDPKESQVDIIQAVGRAIRKAKRKRHGIIILPVYISSAEDEEKTLEDSSFKQVWRVLRALRSHDDTLASELDSLRTKLGRRAKVRANLPAKINVNLPTRLNAKFADAFYLRTVRAITPLPPLTIEQILKWADAHRQKTGKWPSQNSGDVPGASGERWGAIDLSLARGQRGLPGRFSLAQLLAEMRGARNQQALPHLNAKLILDWADAHRQKTGLWPKQKSGDVIGVDGEKWQNIEQALVKGLRGLPGGSSLAKLLAENRGVQNLSNLPDLTIKQILKWADAHHEKTGKWPKASSGELLNAPSETWAKIESVLRQGTRGMPEASSLAKLLADKRGVRNRSALPVLNIEQILRWADFHHQKTGNWPKQTSGAVLSATGERWGNIQNALLKGGRGLPGGSTLAQLLAKKRGLHNPRDLPDLTIKQILEWADAHHQKTGKWPRQTSGAVLGAPGESWKNANEALYRGSHGLPGGSSLAQLLADKRGVRNISSLTILTTERILKWANDHYKRTGYWPKSKSGAVLTDLGEKWQNIEQALVKGLRGLPGGSSLAKLLSEKRGIRNKQTLPKLTIRKIVQWADAHYQKFGKWPNIMSGGVIGSSGERWTAIQTALLKGGRGLPGGSSLAQLLAKSRGVRNANVLPRLIMKQIVHWARRHHQQTDRWPNQNSGVVLGVPGEKWSSINIALFQGHRGLSGGSSLAKLLAEELGVRNRSALPHLKTKQILQWADIHYQKTGKWPKQTSGAVLNAPGEKWGNIQNALFRGGRGLPGGSSLAKLLAEKRPGTKNS